MAGYTFVEKILGSAAGSIVFKSPDLIMTHDNTASIAQTFKKMGGKKVKAPEKLLVVLDHNAPPTSAKLATQYQTIRNLVDKQGIEKFHDAGDGICHQVMAAYARPGMIIVGSDSHTCTAGAFNSLAAGIDRTEAAGLWLMGETWFRVPDTMKITLTGKLQPGVYAKDLSLWIIGMISSSGANYLSIEFHGEGVSTLSMSDRMTLCNLASEMGAKNAVFPADETLENFIGSKVDNAIWADPDANYIREVELNLSSIYPVCAAPHQVDNVKAISQVEGTAINEGIIGTCTNGRIEDLRIAAEILDGKTVKPGFQLLVIPASREIYLEAMKEGFLEKFIRAGATVLSSSCGPCLGTGQGIPADHFRVVSTANRNFLGRMGNKTVEIYLASPATVAHTAINGVLTDPRGSKHEDHYPHNRQQATTVVIPENEYRKLNGVWDYADAHDLNTDQMFAGNLTYNVLSSDAESIMPHLFAGFDLSFADKVRQGDIIIGGDNFGCGSSREHPAVGLAYAGVTAVIVRSINRIFYRSSVNQGLPIIIMPEAVDYYRRGDDVSIDFEQGILTVRDREFKFASLPDKLMEIFKAKGLVNYYKKLSN